MGIITTCACSKSEPGFPNDIYTGIFCVQWFEEWGRGSCSFCWNCWLSLVNLTCINCVYWWQSLNVYLTGHPWYLDLHYPVQSVCLRVQLQHIARKTHNQTVCLYLNVYLYPLKYNFGQSLNSSIIINLVYILHEIKYCNS